MNALRQIIVSLLVVGLGLAALASVSSSVRSLIAALGIDATALAIGGTVPEAGPEARRDQPAIIIVSAPVTTAAAATRLRTIGTGRALRSVALYARAAGEIASVGFAPGDRVSAGHVLATLDQEEERIALDRARVAREEAQATYDRIKALTGRNASSRVSFDEAARALERAVLDLRAAELSYERRLVRAPFDGILGISDVETGELIGPDTLIGTIDDRSKLEIDLYAPERFASLIRLGQPVTGTTAARPGESFPGEIVAIDNRVDPESRTLHLRAAIENRDDALRPGFSFDIEMNFAGETYPAVPALAVQWRAEGAYVWKLDGDKVKTVPVVVVERNGAEALIRAGLAPGDRVVVEGVQKLRPGASVTEATAEAPAAPAPAKS